MALPVPQLVIFGLEYTLWPFYVGTEREPPFNKTGPKIIHDANGKPVRSYPEVTTLLETLHQEKVKVALCSISLDGDASLELIKLFGWDKFIKYTELNFIHYDDVFNKLQKDTNIKFEDMLFFDDLESNIRIAAYKGIHGVLVDENGMTLSLLEKGIREFQAKKPSTTNKP